MVSVVHAIKKNPVLYVLGRETKRTYRLVSEEMRRARWRRQRGAHISSYLQSSAEPKLQVGCGPMQIEGWLNSDLVPDVRRRVIYLDIGEPLPFPDGSLQYVYSEHVIEHVAMETALFHFREVHRVLRPNAVMRVALPDLKFLLDYFSSPELSELQESFLADTVAKFHPSMSFRTPAMLLNDFVRRWGHEFIYDRQLLAGLMTQAGFQAVSHCEVGVSQHSALNGLEQHGNAISDAYNKLQTMVLEATKGAS